MKKTKIKEIAEWTLRNTAKASAESAEGLIRKILKNCGVSLPSGDTSDILQTLMNGDFMFWEGCTIEQARVFADEGQAVLGIDGENMILFVTTDEENSMVVENKSIVRTSATLSEQDTLNMKFFVSRIGTTTTTTTTETELIVVGIPSKNLLVGETMEVCAYTEDNPFCSSEVSWEYDKTVFDMTTQYKFHQTFICLTAKKATKATQIKAKLLAYTSSFTVGIDSMQIYLSPANHYKPYNASVSGNTTERENMEAIASYLKTYLDNYCVEVKITDIHHNDKYDDRPEDAETWFRDKGRAFYFALHSNATSEENAGKAWGAVGYYNRLPGMDTLAQQLAAAVDAILPNGTNRSLSAQQADYDLDSGKKSLGELRIPRQLGYPSILLENGFHDHEAQANFLVQNESFLARTIGNVLVDYFKLTRK